MGEFMEKLIMALKSVARDRVFTDEPMSRHTTFKVGGAADVLVMPSSVDEIIKCMQIFKEYGEDFIIIGKGSNLLVGDGGIRGGVIKLSSDFGAVLCEGNVVNAKSGASLAGVASMCLKNSLTGFEFASGIPGSVGGGVCMNAGAYGGELKDIIRSVTVFKDGEILRLKGEECDFGYRTSRIMKENMVVLEAEFVLETGDYDSIYSKMKELSSKRNEKQPVEFPSAGSTFKRPEGYFAGKLIQDSGLRGYSIGGAQVSEKHCGFIINKGGATAKDVKDLIEYVKKTVYDKFGVVLEPEIRFVGDFV